MLITLHITSFPFKDVSDEFWKRTMEYFSAVPELNYMTQIVLMLYEDPQADSNSDKRFHIELHFSPGVKSLLDDGGKDSISTAFTAENITNPRAVEMTSQRDEDNDRLKNCKAESIERKRKSPCGDEDGSLSDSLKSVETDGEFTTDGGGSSPEPVEQTLSGVEDEKKEIFSCRSKAARSMSECHEYLEKTRLRTDVVGRSDSDNYKNISKSLGKLCDV